MSTYTTKDTNEGLTLRICGIREIQQPVRVYRGNSEKSEVNFVFEDSEQRQHISDAYFAQASQRREVDAPPITIAKVIATFATQRKEFFRNMDEVPCVQLDA